MNYSHIFLICCLLSACSTSESLTPGEANIQNSSQALKTAQLLRLNYGVLSCTRSDRYLNQITNSLLPGSRSDIRYNVEILDTSLIFSVSSSLGDVFISKGLIQALPTPGSLNFIIAHELAHSALNHDHSSTNRIDELAADSWAIQAILRAGYANQDAESAILIAHSAMHYFEQGNPNLKNYPSAAERIYSLRSVAPAPINGPLHSEARLREFKKFKMLLCN